MNRQLIRTAGAALACSALLPAPAAADEGRGPFSAALDYRYVQSLRTPLRLDETGTSAGGGTLGEHRLRLGLEAGLGETWLATFEGELGGVLHGDTGDLPPRLSVIPQAQQSPPGGALLREAYVQHTGLPGVLRVGVMQSQWGLGLLANGGDDPDPFGFARVGDVVARALWATRPLQYASDSRFAQELLVAAAADAVVRDENADWSDGDRAYQAIISVLWARHRRAAGAYFVRREQVDADGDTLSAHVADVFVRWRRTFRLADVALPQGQGAVELSGEGVVVSGHTDRVVTYNAKEGVDVLGLGWVLRGDVELGGSRLRLETGYASGDDNPDDAESRRFGFDPDHQAGLVLFDEVLARRSVRTVERLSDPVRANRPPKGADGLVTDGRIAGAVYLYPTLRVRVRPWLDASGGLLLAWTSATNLDPYTTFRAGGEPRDGFDRAATGRFLGTEALGGLRLHVDDWLTMPVGVGVQAGVFMPDDPADRTVTKVFVAAGIGL